MTREDTDILCKHSKHSNGKILRFPSVRYCVSHRFWYGSHTTTSPFPVPWRPTWPLTPSSPDRVTVVSLELYQTMIVIKLLRALTDTKSWATWGVKVYHLTHRYIIRRGGVQEIRASTPVATIWSPWHLTMTQKQGEWPHSAPCDSFEMVTNQTTAAWRQYNGTQLLW